jgi:hypothetical protein
MLPSRLSPAKFRRISEMSVTSGHVRRPLTKSERAELRAIGPTVEALKVEIDTIAIWIDSGNGPPPEDWTDEMWDYYIQSRSATVA